MRVCDVNGQNEEKLKTDMQSGFFSIARSRPASDITATLGARTSNSGPVVTSKTTYETTTGTPPDDPEHIVVERAPI